MEIKWKNSLESEWSCDHVNKNDVLMDDGNRVYIYNTDYPRPEEDFRWIMLEDLYELLETNVRSKRKFIACTCTPKLEDLHGN